MRGNLETLSPPDPLFQSIAEQKGESEIYVEPNAMTFEDFAAGFTADSDDGWSVEPKKVVRCTPNHIHPKPLNPRSETSRQASTSDPTLHTEACKALLAIHADVV